MKEELKKMFSTNPDRYYKVKLFDEAGFKRKRCKCGSYFWTIDESREHCPNQPCQDYEFIGNPATKQMDYIETWKLIEKFFVKNGHTSIPSYPAVCRWFPGLYFTVASIVAFQRSIAGKTTFELPANPLIIPQTCLRFPDIENVGRTGRHLTNFIMLGQHSMINNKAGDKAINIVGKGYWKDRCIELDYELLTRILKIKPEEVVFVEDVWQGPSAFGSSLEYYVRGLELGNAVFTEFLGTPNNYKEMDQKVIDMGAGLERFTWLSQGTPTCYDAIFGPVIKKLTKLVDYDKELFLKYAKLAGRFEGGNETEIAKRLCISSSELANLKPLEALYAIADHSKTLLFAITDGALPSNVGGGYNLRIILRRALGFIEEFNFDVNLKDVCKEHALYLKRMNPRLAESLDEVYEILDVEKKRFNETKNRSVKVIESLAKKGSITSEKLIELYESNGITPELIEKVAGKNKLSLASEKFYSKISEKHLSEKAEAKIELNLEGLPATRLLFYENQDKTDFNANVIRIIDKKYVIIDQTCFYGRSGGQEPDHGFLGGCEVYDAEKIGNIILHHVRKPEFKAGDTIKGKIDPERRSQLTKHHTATHIINAMARQVLGNHVWQHSAFKDVDKARLDLTHYESLSNEKIELIEKLANEVVKKNFIVKKIVLSRMEAEKKYGFRIYQGGAVPEKELRIIETPFDVEACGGLHCNSTAEVGEIMIIKSERVQDGIVRLEFTANKATEKAKTKQKKILDACSSLLHVPEKDLVKAVEQLFEHWKELRKTQEKRLETAAENKVKLLEKNIANNILIEKIHANMNELQAISKALSNDNRILLLFGLSDKIYVFASAGKNTGINIGKIVEKVCKDLGGKGGGSSYLGQGIGINKEKLDNVIKKLKVDLL